MRILWIRLVNLNSLKGEHFVDLTAEPLAGAGLFAITGRTGAGKTTLLDAVTLALYGRAARYGTESNPENVMSRHTGECSAEVAFEVPRGSYRALWQRHCARKQPDGALQPPRRYVYDAAGEPIAQKVGEAEDTIRDLLGLDYERFLRSVLLAQGEFARFLRASPNERADLLESLTGTEIYSRLSRLAHEEASRRQTDLRLKESVLAQIAVLDEEARRALEADIEASEGRLRALAKDIKSGSVMVARIASLQTARERQSHAETQLAGVKRDREALGADLARLLRHRMTLPFAEDLARLDAADVAAKAAEADLQEARKAHAEASPRALQTNGVLHAAVAAALARCRDRQRQAANAVDAAAKVASEAREWIQAHEADAGLLECIGDLAAAIGDLKTARNGLDSLWDHWRGAARAQLPEPAASLPRSVAGAGEADMRGAMSSFLDTGGRGLKEKKELGIELRRQADLREDHLSKARLVAKLEDHRAGLKGGEPCPLCGALEHPYADGAAPSPRLAALEAEVQDAHAKLLDARGRFTSFKTGLEDLERGQGAIVDGLQSAIEAETRLGALLAPFGSTTPDRGAEDQLRTRLQDRERAFRSRAKAEDDAVKARSDAQRDEAQAREESAALEEKLARLTPLPEALEPLPAPPHGWPSVPDAEREHNDALLLEKTTAARLADRGHEEGRARRRLGEILEPLALAAAATEFETIEALRSARMDVTTAREIEAGELDLQRRETSAKALLGQADQDIGAMVAERVLEGDAAEAFKAEQARMNTARDEILRQQASNQGRIKSDDEAEKRRAEQARALAADQRELVVWRRLRELIGSHDGAKFRRYAQAISLDLLTGHANRHLARLSDRYRIHRDETGVLNLDVMDLHQAGVHRPMASLSGGESFLVSLALALGLSDLAGRTVRIDSLFIDEGFGSLDPETLEVAIDALESLRQHHKTVGVISHVELLKERIATRIMVEKGPGGIGRIRVFPEVESG